MAESQIETFMAAIRRLESGSLQGNYTAVGPMVRSGMYAGDRARGAYQIMGKNWAGWAAEAGLAGADWRDRRAQDAVARHKFNQYYARYKDWRLVAIAWFAGPGRADRAAREGLGALGGIKDVTGTSVPKYVQLIDRYMADALAAGYGPASQRTELTDRLDPQARAGLEAAGADPYTPSIQEIVGGGIWDPDLGGLENLIAPPPADPQTDGVMDADGILRAVFTGLSNRIRSRAAGGQAPVDPDAMTLDDTEED